VRDCLLYNSDYPNFTDSFLNHRIVSNIMTLTVASTDQITEKLTSLYPSPAEAMWRNKLNLIALKFIFELNSLSGEPENGEPSVLQQNYLVGTPHQKCIEKGAQFDKVENDPDIGQPSIQVALEDNRMDSQGNQLFQNDDPFAQDIGNLL